MLTFNVQDFLNYQLKLENRQMCVCIKMNNTVAIFFKRMQYLLRVYNAA